VGGVLPQLVDFGRQRRFGDLAADLAHDHRRHQRLQGADAEPLHGGAHAGDFSTGTVVGDRVGNGDATRGQQRVCLDQPGGLFDVTVGIVQRLLQAQRGVDVGRERELAPARLSSDSLEGVESVHCKKLYSKDCLVALFLKILFAAWISSSLANNAL
jgi:hypothetical protein